MSFSSRISEAEKKAGVEGPDSAFEMLRQAGLSRSRAGRLVTADGRIRWDGMTAEEEGQVRAAFPPAPGVSWSELTDAELRRIAEGEPPEAVLSSTNE